MGRPARMNMALRRYGGNAQVGNGHFPLGLELQDELWSRAFPVPYVSHMGRWLFMVREQIRRQGVFQGPVFLGFGSLVPYELPVGGGGHAVLPAKQLH